MDGTFINLTPNDLFLQDATGQNFKVNGNPDLVTPTSQAMKSDSYIKGIFFIEAITGSLNESTISVNVPMIREHIKYPFTQQQIDKINNYSQGRTRLLILDPKDVEYWSIGRFKCPFRNYRLFTWDNKSLIEYPIPKTYLDYVSDTVESVANVGSKFYKKVGLGSISARSLLDTDSERSER